MKQFEPGAVHEQYNIPHVQALAAAIDEALTRTFGKDTPDYIRYRDAAHFDNGPHNYAYDVPISEVQQSLSRSKARSIALLEQAVRGLKERVEEEGEQEASEASRTPKDFSKRVFLVHGHDDGALQTIARFVERLGFKPVILHERPNKGRTIITKFQEEAGDVGFAIVLMTPDDVGRAAKDGDLRARARQNVVFELGFFIGALGAARVAALIKGNIEQPSDFDGVVYISLDGNDWRTQLGRELEAAGFDIDWNAVMRS